MRQFVLLLALLGLNACHFAEAQLSQEARRQVSVSGQAKERVAPDQASIELSVEGRGATSEKALELAGAAAAAVTTALEKLIPAEQISATQTQLRRVVKGTNQSWIRERGDPTEMLASRQISAQRIPVAQLPALMRALAGEDLAQIQQVSLSVSKAREIEDQLLLLAIDDAKARAQRIATRLGVRLGPPISVDTQSAYAPQPKFAVRAMAMESQADAGGGFDNPGTQDIEAQVQISFELEP